MKLKLFNNFCKIYDNLKTHLYLRNKKKKEKLDFLPTRFKNNTKTKSLILFNHKKDSFNQSIIRHLPKIFLSICFGGLCMFIRLNTQLTPITKRRRFMILSEKQIDSLANLAFQVSIIQYISFIVPKNDPKYKRVSSVVDKILKSNQDLGLIKDIDLEVFILDISIDNAISLRNGKLFICNGMIDTCLNDDQLGIVLSHEIAHIALDHSSETASLLILTRLIPSFIYFFTCLFYPILLPTIVLEPVLIKFLDIVILLPHSRLSELEADQVGLTIAAKSCFDVRQASIIWEKISEKEFLKNKKFQINEEEKDDIQDEDIIDDYLSGRVNRQKEVKIKKRKMKSKRKSEFFSTHPSNEKRCKLIQDQMTEVLAIRSVCNCPSLD